MTKKFSAYVQVHDSSGKYHAFAPGDTVPKWLASKVGDHVLAGTAQAKPAEAEDKTEAEIAAEEAESEQQPEPDTGGEGAKADADEPDFTKPAAPKKAAAKKG